MTDKEQIIIDGVDVSGCSAYENGLCLIHKDKCNARCDYASYYLYEQLARKTAECELLETQLESYHIGEAKFVQRNQELEQECEQIKEKYEALKLENEEGYEIVAELKQECEELKRKVKLMMDCLDCKVDEYKEALDEIEEICRQLLDDDYIRSVAESLIDIIDNAKEQL